MTRNRTTRIALAAGAAAVAVVLTGCAAGQSSTDGQAGAAQSRPSAPPTPTAVTQEVSRPSVSALMICSPEIHNDVKTLLALRRAPMTTSSWANHVYTCTYHLAQGPLVLSVRESGSAAAAREYFRTLRTHVGPARTLTAAEGLGLPAYETSSGSTVFLKDDKTLLVDASHLPASVGSSTRTPADLAYTIATDIMGCWTEG